MTDIKERVAGTKLDAEIAERIFGWVWKHGAHYDVSSVPPDRQWHLLPVDEDISRQPSGEFSGLTDEWPPADGRIVWSCMPNYSTDICDAFHVVEKMRANPDVGFTLVAENMPLVWMAEFSTPLLYAAQAETPSLAICLAALKTLGRKRPAKRR